MAFATERSEHSTETERSKPRSRRRTEPNSLPTAPSADNGRASEQQRPSHEAIASRAYELFLERGGADGSDVDDWLRAERELSTPAQAASE
jgi:hypothetical protein